MGRVVNIGCRHSPASLCLSPCANVCVRACLSSERADGYKAHVPLLTSVGIS